MIIQIANNGDSRALTQIKGCYFECGGMIGGSDGYAVNVDATTTRVNLLSENNTYINSGTDKQFPPDGAIGITDYLSMVLISCGDVFDGGTCGWTLDTVFASGVGIIENASLLNNSTISNNSEPFLITVGASTVAGDSEG